MLRRVGHPEDVAPVQMRALDVAGTTVNVAIAGSRRHAFDDTCIHTRGWLVAPRKSR